MEGTARAAGEAPAAAGDLGAAANAGDSGAALGAEARSEEGEDGDESRGGDPERSASNIANQL